VFINDDVSGLHHDCEVWLETGASRADQRPPAYGRRKKRTLVKIMGD
jgi:hypothetical protein